MLGHHDMTRPNDPFQDFIALCETWLLSEGATETCPGLQWGRAQGDITMAEGIQAMIDDPEFSPRWCRMVRQHMAAELTTAWKRALTAKATTRLRNAAQCDIDIPDLDRVEIEMVLDAWHPDRRVGHGKLTRIAEEIRTGVIVRARDL